MTDEGKLRTWQELESDHRPAQLNQGMRLGVGSAALQSRYANAFRQAGSLVTLGQIVKVLGIFVGGLVFLCWLVVGSAFFRNPFLGTSADSLAIGVFVGALYGAFAWLIFFVIGVLISARGEALFAVLDTALNTSPLIDNTQRIAAMRLKVVG